MICIGRHVGGERDVSGDLLDGPRKKERLLVVYFGGHTLALQYGGQNYFFLHLVKRLIVTLRRCCKRDHIIFSTISLKFKCTISAQKEVIHSFINHILVT